MDVMNDYAFIQFFLIPKELNIDNKDTCPITNTHLDDGCDSCYYWLSRGEVAHGVKAGYVDICSRQSTSSLLTGFN